MRPIDADALIEFCAERWIPLNIDAVNMQPTIQPVATDTNVGDKISRQVAIDAFDKAPFGYLPDQWMSIKTLEGLPPAQPEKEEGEWIPVTNGRGGHECDRCHEYAPSYQSGDEHLSKYCPNCGAKMKGERQK